MREIQRSKPVQKCPILAKRIPQFHLRCCAPSRLDYASSSVHNRPGHCQSLFGYTVPFRFPIQMTFSLPFQNGEKAIFTPETVAQLNGPFFAKQALICYQPHIYCNQPHYNSQAKISGVVGFVINEVPKNGY